MYFWGVSFCFKSKMINIVLCQGTTAWTAFQLCWFFLQKSNLTYWKKDCKKRFLNYQIYMFTGKKATLTLTDRSNLVLMKKNGLKIIPLLMDLRNTPKNIIVILFIIYQPSRLWPGKLKCKSLLYWFQRLKQLIDKWYLFIFKKVVGFNHIANVLYEHVDIQEGLPPSLE